jgi:hypothetical protein
LAAEYPEAIYVADGDPKSGAPWDGGDVYGYLFWDAYYKDLLPASITADPKIRALARERRSSATDRELHLGKWIDAFTYACDLWTYIGHRYVFTVWANEHARDPHRPRRHQVDGNDPGIRETQLRLRTDVPYLQHSEQHSRHSSQARFIPKPDGTWKLDTAAWDHLAEEWRNLFPAELRGRCFVVFLRGNPHFMQSLTPEERARTELQYEVGQRNLEGEGYRVVQLRAQDFTPDDYLDGGHLVASGGAKVAQAVAARIQAVREPPPAARRP